jgi:hypothetical protein
MVEWRGQETEKVGRLREKGVSSMTESERSKCRKGVKG